MPHLHTGARAGVGWDRVPTASVQRIEDEADAMDKGMNPKGDAGEPTTGVVGSSRSKKPSKGACTAQCSCTWCCCSWQRSVEPWRSSCGRGARTYRAPGCTIPPRAAPSASSHAFPRRQPYPIGYTRVSLSSRSRRRAACSRWRPLTKRARAYRVRALVCAIRRLVHKRQTSHLRSTQTAGPRRPRQ